MFGVFSSAEPCSDLDPAEILNLSCLIQIFVYLVGINYA